VSLNLVSSKIQDGNVVKAMPGSILHPIQVHSKIANIKAAKWGTPRTRPVLDRFHDSSIPQTSVLGYFIQCTQNQPKLRKCAKT